MSGAARELLTRPIMLIDGLAEFIATDRIKIVAEWEAFTASLTPAAKGMNDSRFATTPTRS